LWYHNIRQLRASTNWTFPVSNLRLKAETVFKSEFLPCLEVEATNVTTTFINEMVSKQTQQEDRNTISEVKSQKEKAIQMSDISQSSVLIQIENFLS